MQEPNRSSELLETLVRRAQDGDAVAFEELLRKCYRDIYRWALVQTGDPDDADDVVQEVLLRLHRRLRSYRGRSRFTTWLFQITRNAALELHRTRMRAQRLARRVDRLKPDDQDGAVDRLEQLHTSSVVEVVRVFLHDLPSRQRQIFDLADLQGYAPTEIGRMLEMNPVTVRANLCKARRAIRTKILERHPEMVEGLRS